MLRQKVSSLQVKLVIFLVGRRYRALIPPGAVRKAQGWTSKHRYCVSSPQPSLLPAPIVQIEYAAAAVTILDLFGFESLAKGLGAVDGVYNLGNMLSLSPTVHLEFDTARRKTIAVDFGTFRHMCIRRVHRSKRVCQFTARTWWYLFPSERTM